MADQSPYQSIIAADVGSGTLKTTDGLTVDGSQIIVPIDSSTPEGTIGQAWQLEGDQVLKISYSLPASAEDAQLVITLAGLQDVAAKVTVRINNGQSSTYPSPDNKKVKQQHIDLAEEALAQGSNTIQFGSAGGRVGIQAVRIAFGVPYPQLTFGSQDSPASLTLLEPAPLGSTIGQGQTLTFRWRTDNAPSDTYVKLMYQEAGSRWFPFPGATTLPYNAPNGIGNGGVYQPALPATVATLQLTAQPFALGLPTQETVLLQQPTDFCLHLWQITPDFQYALFVGLNDPASVSVWGLPAGSFVRRLTSDQNTNEITRLLVSPESKYCLLQQYGSILPAPFTHSLWSIDSGEIERTFALPSGLDISCFLPNGRGVLANVSTKLQVLDSQDGTLHDLYASDSYVSSSVISPDGTRIIVGLARQPGGGAPQVWATVLLDAQSGTEIWRKQDLLSRDFSFSMDGQSILVHGWLQHTLGQSPSPGFLALLDAATGNQIAPTYPTALGTLGTSDLTNFGAALQFMPDGKRVLTVETVIAPSGSLLQGTFLLRNVSDGTLLTSVPLPTGQGIIVDLNSQSTFEVVPNGKCVLAWVGHIETGGYGPKLLALPLPPQINT
jgi:hypothetical protein